MCVALKTAVCFNISLRWWLESVYQPVVSFYVSPALESFLATTACTSVDPPLEIIDDLTFLRLKFILPKDERSLLRCHYDIVPRFQQVHGWAVTAIGFLINIVELGTFKSFGVFIMPIQESLRGSFTSVGTAMAASHTICCILGRSTCTVCKL